MSDSNSAPSWLRYANRGAKRNLPINNDLVSALGFLEDMGIEMEVFSGGQVTKEEAKAGKGQRTGSVRHDHGSAADVFFYQNGRKLDWSNPSDVPVVNRRRNGTPYRLPKGTPASSCIGSARVGPGLSI